AAHISPLVLAGLMLTVKFWLQRREKGAATRWFKSFVWLGIGFTVGLLPVVAYFGLLDLLPRIGLVFSLGFGHVSSASVSPLFILLYPLLGLAIANLPWLIAGIAGALGLLLDKSVSFPHKILIPLWLLLSLVEVGFSRNPFTHYYLVLVPPLSVAAAWLLTRLYQAAQGTGWPKFAALAAPALLLLTISAAYLFVNGRYLYHYTLYQTGQETHRTFIRESWPTVGPMYVALQDISDYVQIHSKPEDRIYIWGEETQLYFLANRRCALDFIWPLYLTHPAIPGSETMPGRLLAPTTKLIIISQNDPPDWLVDGLAQNYRLAETISGRKIYQRIGCETCVESAAQ
ncbi:MAG TPA: hypothetical protein VEC96_08705, partial [Anaerolineae bacterium]|nr:hypothetical protein [Anaerolineae bacterium]